MVKLEGKSQSIVKRKEMEVQPGNLSNATKAEVTDDGEPRACLGPETQRMRKGSQPNAKRK